MAEPARRFDFSTMEAFLDWEAGQDERWEKLGNLIRAMVGERAAHNLIALNIASALRAALKGTRCTVFMENVKAVSPAGDVMYPDVMVTCGAVSPDQLSVPDPVAIFEILSKSSEQFDRGAKFEAYRSIPSLRHYVLVDQGRPSVEPFTVDEGGRWTIAPPLTGLDAVLTLPAIGQALRLVDIYEGISR